MVVKTILEIGLAFTITAKGEGVVIPVAIAEILAVSALYKTMLPPTVATPPAKVMLAAVLKATGVPVRSVTVGL